MHNFKRECQSHWRKNFLPYICYVATIQCESLRHKSNTFHTILALCTYLYRSHLSIVSTKQTKHSRKSEAQNLCSKCPPFTRTRASKRLRHCAIAAAMTVWSSSLQHGECHVYDVPVPHLAEKGSNPRKQSGYPAEAYSAELYYGNSHH